MFSPLPIFQIELSNIVKFSDLMLLQIEERKKMIGNMLVVAESSLFQKHDPILR